MRPDKSFPMSGISETWEVRDRKNVQKFYSAAWGIPHKSIYPKTPPVYTTKKRGESDMIILIRSDAP